MDFTLLTVETFHLLCGRLLREEGYTIHEMKEKAFGVGVDYVVSPPGSADRIVVEWSLRAKEHAHRPDVRDKLEKIKSLQQLLGVQRGMIIFSSELTAPARDELAAAPNVDVWDGADLRQLLDRHPHVAAEFGRLLDHSRRVTQWVMNPTQDQILNADLQRRLLNHPSGNDHWRQYEDLCIEILNCLFVPPLGMPAIQSRTEDGLDRRDAVYPIRAGDRFWGLVRSEYRSRMVVAEFKNYTDPIGQKEVESIQQYLFDKAFRMFGLLCCRKGPSDHALKARRRVWSEAGKMIVILSDIDLLEMLRMNADEEDPTGVIDLQLDGFLSELAP